MMELNPERRPSQAELRWFGAVPLVFFGLVGALLHWRFDLPGAARVVWASGLAMSALVFLVPPLRLPIYLAWMRATAPLGWLVSHVVLAGIFYLVLTPIALCMRAFRRDPLKLRRDRAAESHWCEHDPAAEPERYFRQS